MFLFLRNRCDKSDGELSIVSTSQEQHISHNSVPEDDEGVEIFFNKRLDLENNEKYLEALYLHSQNRSQRSLDSLVLEEFMNPQINGERFDIQFDKI